MLVAIVLVAPPRHFVVEPVAGEHARVVGHVVVRVREAERRDHQRRLQPLECRCQQLDEVFGWRRDVARVVRVLDAREVDRRRREDLQCGLVLGPAHGHDVVTRSEPTLHVPCAHRVRVRGRIAGEHGDDGCAGVGGKQGAAPEDGVVEVRRNHDHACELAVERQPPLPHREDGSVPIGAAHVVTVMVWSCHGHAAYGSNNRSTYPSSSSSTVPCISAIVAIP